MLRNLAVFAGVVCLCAGVAFAQGSQTGVLFGTVRSADDLPLPGVTVTVTSPALLGTRTATSDANGGYIFRGLPAGSYEVTLELSGFATVKKTLTIAVGSNVPNDATMTVATLQESVTVTGGLPTPLTTTQVGANYKSSMIDTLATSRTVFGVAQLAPGLSTNTPNANQVTIAGNFAYDNVFLVDGVDINDNLFGTPHDLFIEDAIEETQVLTSGIAAEYGRFGGGVINAVTKRGGNQFSGSFRVNFTNPAWRDETPREDEQEITRESATNRFYEATLGGPIVRDRLWFFAAGRSESRETQSTLPETSAPFTRVLDQERFEIKLSGAITPNHNVSGAYTRVSQDDFRQTFDFSIDPEHTAFQGKFPNDLLVVNYSGILSPRLHLEAQYSKKDFEFQDLGGTSTAIVDSPYLSFDPFTHYNAPYFDATDPEQRNNEQSAVSLSYFISTGSLGKHDLKVGFENFRSTNIGGNSQSATNYVFYTNYLQNADGSPAFDADGFVIPVFTPGESQLQNWRPVRGAQIDIRTNSLYLNDRWRLNDRWSFNLGVRAEWASSETADGVQGVDASRIVPRLGAAFDVRGDGRFKLEATYSHYAGKYTENLFAANTNVGNPDAIYYLYDGPPGQGRNFAPGIDPANYPTVLGGVFPTANVLYDPDIKSSLTKEWTGAFGMQLGHDGYFKTIYTWRRVGDFVQEFVTPDTGTTNVVTDGIDFGTFSNRLRANSADGVRDYQGLQFQLGYRVTDRWRWDGHWTFQLENDGNQEGEAANQPGTPSVFSGFYPEIFTEARHFPIGRLDDFVEHRVRVWTTYDLGLGRAGNLNLGALYRFDSGRAYSLRSLARPLTSVQNDIAAQVYPDTPSSQDIYYAPGRGSETFESAHLFDFALTYGVPVFKSLRPWAKFEVRNMFNSTPLIAFNTTVTPDPNSPRDALGIPTGFIRGTQFGRGTATTHYPFPREFLMSVGIRF